MFVYTQDDIYPFSTSQAQARGKRRGLGGDFVCSCFQNVVWSASVEYRYTVLSCTAIGKCAIQDIHTSSYVYALTWIDIMMYTNNVGLCIMHCSRQKALRLLSLENLDSPISWRAVYTCNVNTLARIPVKPICPPHCEVGVVDINISNNFCISIFCARGQGKKYQFALEVTAMKFLAQEGFIIVYFD
jgi:hypothetical protein